MKTDTIFYTIIQNLPSVLFELLEQPATQASHYEFSSVEIKELSRRNASMVYFYHYLSTPKTQFILWRYNFSVMMTYIGD